jgi:hypothetical protein
MSASIKPGKQLLAISMLGIVIALVLVIHLASPPASGLWLQTFANSVHVPFFGAIALSLFVFTGTMQNLDLGRRILISIGAAFLLGALSELAQIPGPRDASVEDLLSDWLGAAGTVLFAAAFSRSTTSNVGLRRFAAIFGLSLLLIALWPLIRISAAYLERNYRVPSIATFDSRFGRRFILAQHTSLQIIETAPSGRKIANVNLLKGAWPGLVFHDIWPDWREYSTLVIEFGMPEATPLDLNVRVHDRVHRQSNQAHSDRFNMEYELQPGLQTLRIPLARIQKAPAGRKMDLSQIEGIVIFCSAKNAGRSFQLMSIRLE